MEILQFARRFVAEHWGGTETVIASTTANLLERGHRSELWTSSALSSPGKDNVRGVPLRRFSYVYPFFGLSERDKEALDRKGGNMFSPSMMQALLLRSSSDIYHLHTGKRFGAQAAFAARLRGRPYVMTLHGGAATIPKAEMDDMLLPIEGKIEWGKAVGALLGSRSLLDRASAVICVDPSEVEPLQKLHPNQRVIHIPNGVHPEAFAGGDGTRFRHEYGYGDEERIVLCVGRIDHQKNQQGLVKAFAKANSEKARLILLGPVTNEYYAEGLKHLIEESGQGEKIRIMKPLSHEGPALADAYAASDICILPSLHEPFGIVLLEAWAAGRPVLAANIGGPARIVDDGEDGLLVDSEDTEALAIAMKRLIDDAELCRSLGEKGRRKAAEKYSWSSVVGQLLRLYEDLIEGRGR